MSSAARGRKIWRWIGNQAQARNAVAPTRCTRIHAAVIFLFLILPTAFVSVARADTFAAGSRAYAARNYVLAGQIFLPLAEERDARAQTYLGVMYLRGQGVTQNFAVAAYWLQLASSAGVPTAQYFFGLMYDKGQGVAQDFVLAQAWLNLAVAHAEPRLRDRWVLIRNAVASKMTEAQLAEARRLAYQWQPEPYLALNWHLYIPR
ncbi:MAG TPA: tetratricopeptide repeat protein [Roseiarcus sp.]|nr:tetratricopeptide repeat protein [Roseiarcus sp.]